MPNGECSPDKRMERNGCERIGKRTQSACTGNFKKFCVAMNGTEENFLNSRECNEGGSEN